MKKIIFPLLRSILIWILSFCFVRPVAAHGSEPRLEINVERANPGSIVEIRGVEFDYEEAIVLALMRSEMQIPLGDVTADVEGTFTKTIILPADLPTGEYSFRGSTTHHMVNSPLLIVWGVAVSSGEGGEDTREEDDGLLAPMPTVAPGFSSTALPQARVLEPPASEEGTTTLVYSIAAGIVIISLVGIRLLKKR